jgi:TetR/AcrR family transcriptional repressor of nem operon
MLSMEPVTTKKGLSHQRIVDAAARAMRRSGFSGVGVADVMKDAGLTHGGFYAHFQSREAMLSEALTRAGEDSSADLTRRAKQFRAQGASSLRALIEGYLSETHLADADSGCPVAALLGEVPRQSPELRNVALQRVQSLVETIRTALPDPQAKEQAVVIAATLVGALQMARALGANAKGKSVLAAARRSLLAAHDSV